MKRLETYMQRYDPADWVSIMLGVPGLGVLARNSSIYCTNDQSSGS